MRRRHAQCGGHHHLQPLAAHLDGDRLPVGRLGRLGRSWAGIGAANSVSIQRVCTRSGWPANAGSATTARWNGSTVGMPPTSNSASARAARCSAWARLAPVTISLAISESNTCGTVIPAAYPASTRTPGPDGGLSRR